MSKNKYLFSILAVIGAIIINVFSERIYDYITYLEDRHSNTKTSIDFQTASKSYMKPSFINDIDDLVEEFKQEKKTSKTIQRCKEDLSKKCFGKYVDPENSYAYVGIIENNLPNGYGKLIDSDGWTYRGEIKNGLFDGYGVMTDDMNRLVYDGDWADDEANGYGIKYFEDQKYEGDFKDGEYHGQGKFYYGTHIYEGEWRQGVEHGLGLEIYNDGSRIKGTFVHGMLEGYVEIEYYDGDTYKGNMRAGKKDGNGVYTYADRTEYDGQYKAGSWHGRGIMTYPDGEKHIGEYLSGELHGEATRIYSNGAKETGSCHYGLKHGEHVYTDKADIIKKLPLKRRMDGQRFISWAAGDSELSTYRDGYKNGIEEYTYEKVVSKCQYRDGRKNGKCENFDAAKKLTSVCTYKENIELEYTDYDGSIIKVDKVKDKVFGFVKEAGSFIGGAGKFLTGDPDE